MQQPARRLCGTSRHTSTRTLDIERPSPAEGGIPISAHGDHARWNPERLTNSYQLVQLVRERRRRAS